MAALKSVRTVSAPSGAMYMSSQPEFPRMAETAKPSRHRHALTMLRPGFAWFLTSPAASSIERS